MIGVAQLTLATPFVGLSPVPIGEANALLDAWGHYLGPTRRPFGQQGWVLTVEGVGPVSVAVSASIVSATVSTYRRNEAGDLEVDETFRRGEVVELARLCSAPDAGWATRPMLRLWREVCAPAWRYWPVRAAVAYSANARHPGDVYRFDGWTRVRADCGSSGGGAWSRKRYATDAAHGRKTLWIWTYRPREVRP